MIAVAADEHGRGIRRFRMQRTLGTSAASLMPFTENAVDCVAHTDGWLGYLPLKGSSKAPSELMPRVHLSVSRLNRGRLGNHLGAVSLEDLDAYLVGSRSGSAGESRTARESFSAASWSKLSPSNQRPTNRWPGLRPPWLLKPHYPWGYPSQVNAHARQNKIGMI
jgi:hypothetical protein